MLKRLEKRFQADSPTMNYLKTLQKSGLSAARLVKFVDDNPSSRINLIESLVKSDADLERFNNQMKLSLFSDETATKLVDAAENNGMKYLTNSGAFARLDFRRSLLRSAGETMQHQGVPFQSKICNR